MHLRLLRLHYRVNIECVNPSNGTLEDSTKAPNQLRLTVGIANQAPKMRQQPAAQAHAPHISRPLSFSYVEAGVNTRMEGYGLGLSCRHISKQPREQAQSATSCRDVSRTTKDPLKVHPEQYYKIVLFSERLRNCAGAIPQMSVSWLYRA